MVSTHEDIGKERRKLFDKDQKKVISTRNLIPTKREVNKNDIARMAAAASGKVQEEIKKAELSPVEKNGGVIEPEKPKRGRPRKENKDAVSS